MGISLNALGDLIGTQRVQEESLATYRWLNLPKDGQILLGSLGHTTLQFSDYVTTEKQLTEALAIAIQTRDEFWQAWVKLRLGEMWRKEYNTIRPHNSPGYRPPAPAAVVMRPRWTQLVGLTQ